MERPIIYGQLTSIQIHYHCPRIVIKIERVTISFKLLQDSENRSWKKAFWTYKISTVISCRLFARK